MQFVCMYVCVWYKCVWCGCVCILCCLCMCIGMWCGKKEIKQYYLGAWQVESTISHLADLHFFVRICSAVLKANPLPNWANLPLQVCTELLSESTQLSGSAYNQYVDLQQNCSRYTAVLGRSVTIYGNTYNRFVYYGNIENTLLGMR